VTVCSKNMQLQVFQVQSSGSRKIHRFRWHMRWSPKSITTILERLSGMSVFVISSLAFPSFSDMAWLFTLWFSDSFFETTIVLCKRQEKVICLVSPTTKETHCNRDLKSREGERLTTGKERGKKCSRFQFVTFPASFDKQEKMERRMPVCVCCSFYLFFILFSWYSLLSLDLCLKHRE
jgi:hypothetical protein